MIDKLLIVLCSLAILHVGYYLYPDVFYVTQARTIGDVYVISL